jgi:hypothetical protein
MIKGSVRFFKEAIMIFKYFEFRPLEKDKYELVKWQTGRNKERYCLVIGYVSADKDNCWKFEGVGMRYQQEYVEGLNEFVLKYVELLQLQKKYYDKEVEEFYEHY